MIILASLSVCFASSNLKTLEKQITVDYKMSDDSYSKINKSLVENKTYYELEDVDRKDNLKTLTINYEVIDSKETTTNNLEKVIEMFNPTKDIEKDGYTGTITRDNSSLNISIKIVTKKNIKFTYKNIQ